MTMWSQTTESWGFDETLDGAGLGSEEVNTNSELWWDSSRGLFSNFSLHRGSKSLGDWEDDVFPSKVQVLLTLVQAGDPTPDARLLGPVAKERNIAIDNADLFGDEDFDEPQYIRIDDEWMRVKSASGRNLSVDRAVRMTVRKRHEAGSAVVLGRSFRFTINIPAHRSDYSLGLAK
jgi:hypothetical protein